VRSQYLSQSKNENSRSRRSARQNHQKSHGRDNQQILQGNTGSTFVGDPAVISTRHGWQFIVAQ
jgi:hypothetical protein